MNSNKNYIEEQIITYKNESVGVSNFNELANEKILNMKNDLKRREIEIINIKKLIEDLSETIKEGNFEKENSCGRIDKLIDNLEKIKNNNVQVFLFEFENNFHS